MAAGRDPGDELRQKARVGAADGRRAAPCAWTWPRPPSSTAGPRPSSPPGDPERPGAPRPNAGRRRLPGRDRTSEMRRRYEAAIEHPESRGETIGRGRCSGSSAATSRRSGGPRRPERLGTRPWSSSSRSVRRRELVAAYCNRAGKHDDRPLRGVGALDGCDARDRRPAGPARAADAGLQYRGSTG